MSLEKSRFWCLTLLDLVHRIGNREGWNEAREQLIPVLRSKFLAIGKETIGNTALSKDEVKDAVNVVGKFAGLNLLNWQTEAVPENVLLQKGECLLNAVTVESGIPKEFYLRWVCEACLTGVVRSVSDNVSAIVEEAQCEGSKSCKFVFSLPNMELKEALYMTEEGALP